MSGTFVDEDPQRKEVKVRTDTEKPKQKTQFDIYLESLGEKYIGRCKEMAQQTEYTINIRNGDKEDPIKFTRKHLTQGQLEQIEDLRVTAQDLLEGDRGTKKQRMANRLWYLKIGESILFNTKAQRMLNNEDFDNAINRDIKPILDGVIMAEMSGVPN